MPPILHVFPTLELVHFGISAVVVVTNDPSDDKKGFPLSVSGLIPSAKQVAAHLMPCGSHPYPESVKVHT